MRMCDSQFCTQGKQKLSVIYFSLIVINFFVNFNVMIQLFFLDVAFEVGGDSGIAYLVLQVHYGKVDQFVGKYMNITLYCALNSLMPQLVK